MRISEREEVLVLTPRGGQIKFLLRATRDLRKVVVVMTTMMIQGEKFIYQLGHDLASQDGLHGGSKLNSYITKIQRPGIQPKSQIRQNMMEKEHAVICRV
jgi:hypothetical protein